MNRFRGRKSWIALTAILLLFAACKGESPTAPPPGSGVPPGSGTPPPTGVAIALTATNLNPLVDSTVTITATVTDNGNPVANGTAVEWSATTNGVLDGSGTAIVKTTTNGAASVTLTSSSVGLVRVTAVVGSVSRQIDINFQQRPVVDPPPNTAPTITAITPAVGRPQGGEVIRITGTNFKAPVRVLFDTGGALPVEGSVQSVSTTEIQVITPPVNLGAGQQLAVDVIVLTQAGTTSEQRVEQADAFTYRNEQLVPVISTVTPNSGPVVGGTRVTIFGEGFQDPVQVLFGTAEARVLTVQYDRILVETPAARDTNPDGSGTVTGPVSVTVRNINSNREASMSAGFHYKAAMQITAAGPTEGLPSGGTQVTIDGIGFVAPVTVTIAGVAAQPTFVSGTRVVAITGAAEIESCADVTGPIVVTNVNNGDQAEGPEFSYEVPEPIIISVVGASNPIIPGSSISVRVLNAGLFPQLQIGERGLTITSSTPNGDGTTTFVTTIPTTTELETQACPAGGTRSVPTPFDLTFTSLDTGCTVTLSGGLTVEPPPFGRLFLTPNPLEIAATADDPLTVPNEEVDGTGLFTIVNTGAEALTITGVTSNNVNFTVTSNPTGTTLQPCDSTIVVMQYEAAAAPTIETALVSVQATTGTPVQNLVATETVIGRTQ